MPQQELSSSELYGIAKRINNELEAFPLYTHGAITEMVKVAFEHRNKALQFAHMTAQHDQQERIIRLKEFEMQAAQRQADAAIALDTTPPN